MSQVLLSLEFRVRHRDYPAACSMYSRDDACYPHAMATVSCNSATRCPTIKRLQGQIDRPPFGTVH
jgi:hypothetical protein